MFKLVKEIWKERKKEEGNFKLSVDKIFEMLDIVYAAFYIADKNAKKGLTKIETLAIFRLLEDIGDRR